MVSGRRSGKSFISSVVATYLACFSNYGKQLTAGERAVILVSQETVIKAVCALPTLPESSVR
jgi:hypothetical protein